MSQEAEILGGTTAIAASEDPVPPQEEGIQAQEQGASSDTQPQGQQEPQQQPTQQDILRREAERSQREAAEQQRALAEVGMRYLAEQQAAQQKQQPQQDPLNPDNYPLGQFDPAYIRATVQAQAREEAKALLAEQAREAAIAKRAAEIRADVETFAVANPDYHDATAALTQIPEIANSQAIYHAVSESETPAALAYHLAKHPEEALKIAQAHPMTAARMLGRIEERIANSKASPQGQQQAPVSNAPAPITPVRGSGPGSASADPAKAADMADYVKRREAQLRRSA